MAKAIKNANATLARMGMDRDEKTGAAVNSANTRRKGQNRGEIQAASCASVKEITARSGQATAPGMASMVRRMYSTSMVNIHGPAIAKTAITAINLGTKASVAS